MSHRLKRLDPPIPLATPLGDASAYFVIDDGRDDHLRWVVFINSTGECWTLGNPQIRLNTNITEMRGEISPFSAADLEHFGPIREAMTKRGFDCEAPFVKCDTALDIQKNEEVLPTLKTWRMLKHGLRCKCQYERIDRYGEHWCCGAKATTVFRLDVAPLSENEVIEISSVSGRE